MESCNRKSCQNVLLTYILLLLAVHVKRGENMTVDDVTQIIRSGLCTIIITSAPMLIVSLVVGLIISVFQTVTSIQEQTLTFVPKILAIFATLMLVGHWMANNLTTFTADLWNSFSVYIH